MVNDNATIIKTNVDYALDLITSRCLIKENWRELEKLKDEKGIYRSIMIGMSLSDEEREHINDYFKPTRLRLEFNALPIEPEGFPNTLIKIRNV